MASASQQKWRSPRSMGCEKVQMSLMSMSITIDLHRKLTSLATQHRIWIMMRMDRAPRFTRISMPESIHTSMVNKCTKQIQTWKWHLPTTKWTTTWSRLTSTTIQLRCSMVRVLRMEDQGQSSRWSATHSTTLRKLRRVSTKSSSPRDKLLRRTRHTRWSHLRKLRVPSLRVKLSKVRISASARMQMWRPCRHQGHAKPVSHPFRTNSSNQWHSKIWSTHRLLHRSSRNMHRWCKDKPLPILMTRAMAKTKMAMGLKAAISRSRAKMRSIGGVLVMDMISLPSFSTSKVKI